MRQIFYGGLALVGVVAISATVDAAEQGVVRARYELNKAEHGIKSLKAGDVSSANKLIDRVNAAIKLLGKCKDRSDPEWKTEAARTKTVNAAIRAKLAGSSAPKPPAQSSKPDAVTMEGKKLADQAALGFRSMKPGDVAAANRLVKILNASRA